jgi:hypothetical protein
MYRLLKLENFDRIERLKMLRYFYNFSLSEAKAIESEIDGEGSQPSPIS